MFEKVKKFYDLNLYTDTQVKQFVIKGKLTQEQYKEITGKDYE